jgi:GNAT superfamily N-acetyltransferase
MINQITLTESMNQSQIRIEHLGSHVHALQKIVSWVHAEWGPLMPDTPYSKMVSQFKERLSPHKIPETFVALRRDEIVGTASIVPHDMSTRMDLSPWLAAVYVPSEYRGMGIGSALVRAAIDEARYVGLERFYLITPDRVSFYTRLGWVELEKAEYRGENVTIMTYLVQEPP